MSNIVSKYNPHELMFQIPARGYNPASFYGYETRAQAMTIYTQMLCASHRFSPAAQDSAYPLVILESGEHPFEAMLNTQCAVAGFLGDSDSIGIFLPTIGKSLADHAIDLAGASLHIWSCPAPGSQDPDNQHMIIAECRDGEEQSLFCGGMTDFSGSGGAAFRSLLSVFMLFSWTYDLSITFSVSSAERYKGFCDRAASAEVERGTKKEL